MRILGRTLGLGFAVMALVACSGGGGKLGTNEVAMIEVQVLNDSVDLYEKNPPSFTHFFSQTVQATDRVPVKILNRGIAPFTLSNIAWATAADGGQQRNSYVAIDWQAIGGQLDFPVEIPAAAELEFFVEYAPTPGAPLDDFTDSILEIETNAKAPDGQTKVPLIQVNFKVPNKTSSPEVAPPNFEFTSPTTQTFTVYNDCETGTDPFMVNSVTFAAPTTEFNIIGGTALPSEVSAGACDPDLPGVVNFTVAYAPTDSSADEATVLVSVEGLDQPIPVPLQGTQQDGGWEITHDSTLELDFTAWDEDDVCESGGDAPCRSFQLRSLGPGVLLVKTKPEVVLDVPPASDDAPAQFTWNAYTPASKDPQSESCNPTDGTPPAFGCNDSLQESWPRSLKKDAVLRFDVSYTAPIDPAVEPSNGQLILALELPDNTLEIAALDLFAGEPKGKLVTAPDTGAIVVTASAWDKGNSCDGDNPCSKVELCDGGTCGADTGVRHVVLYNEGSGPLTIDSLVVKDEFGVNKLFDLVSPPATPFDIAPSDLEVLEVGWDTTSLVDIADGEGEILEINYVDPYTLEVVPKVIGLQLLGDEPDVQPIADIALSAEPYVVDERIDVHGGASDAGGGGYSLAEHSYVWYLIDKPVGSKTRLNQNGGVAHGFIPDRQGDYTIELFIVVDDGAGHTLVSEAETVTITVGPASE